MLNILESALIDRRDTGFDIENRKRLEVHELRGTIAME